MEQLQRPGHLQRSADLRTLEVDGRLKRLFTSLKTSLKSILSRAGSRWRGCRGAVIRSVLRVLVRSPAGVLCGPTNPGIRAVEVVQMAEYEDRKTMLAVKSFYH